jgi:hypothetical protein
LEHDAIFWLTIVSRWAGTRLDVCAFECGEVVVAFGDQPALVQSKRRLIDSELMEQRGQTAFSNCPLFINQSFADKDLRLALSGNALSELLSNHADRTGIVICRCYDFDVAALRDHRFALCEHDIAVVDQHNRQRMIGRHVAAALIHLL